MPTTSDYLNQLIADKEAIEDNLEERGITVPSGATFTDLVPLVEGIPSGGGESVGTLVLNDMPSLAGSQNFSRAGNGITKVKFKNLTVTSLKYAFTSLQYIEEVDGIPVGQITSTENAFRNCQYMERAPYFDTSNVTNMSNMFYYCKRLEYVPIYDTSKVTNFSNMFSQASNNTTWTNDGLNNVLKMCINATRYSETKTLATLGLNSTVAPSSTITGLSNYQDFLTAGWTIGY